MHFHGKCPTGIKGLLPLASLSDCNCGFSGVKNHMVYVAGSIRPENSNDRHCPDSSHFGHNCGVNGLSIPGDICMRAGWS
jgi:hypothetical protein